MRAIFGVCVNSISLVADNLRIKAPDYSVYIPSIGDDEVRIQKGIAGSTLILLSNVAMLRRFASKLDNKVVLVFDSPINLCFVQGIVYLDSTKKSLADGLSYKWMFKTIDYNIVLRALKNKLNIKPMVVNVDLLPVIIENKINGKLMEPINNLVYNSTNHLNRISICHALYEWATGKNTSKQTMATIKKLLDMNPYRVKLMTALQNVLDSQYGKNIVLAIKERERLRKTEKNVQYKKLEKQFSVQAADLKGLIALEEG